MDAGPDLGLGVLRPHGAAPDLGVVEEEELVVRHVQSRQVRLGAVKSDPLLVGSVGLNRGNVTLVIFTISPFTFTALAKVKMTQNCNILYSFIIELSTFSFSG